MRKQESFLPSPPEKGEGGGSVEIENFCRKRRKGRRKEGVALFGNTAAKYAKRKKKMPPKGTCVKIIGLKVLLHGYFLLAHKCELISADFCFLLKNIHGFLPPAISCGRKCLLVRMRGGEGKEGSLPLV